MTYAEKLKDPRWQKKRLKILERDDWRCQMCYDNEKMLSVHHRLYRKGIDPWEYKDDELVTLCPECHEHETDCLKEYSDLLFSVLKSKFFSEDLFDLANMFNKLKIKNESSWTVSALTIFLNDNIEQIYDYYEKYLKESARKKLEKQNRT